jgi:hypothetical protein
MEKRGNVELMILFVVLIVAIVGLVFVVSKKPHASGMDTLPIQDNPGAYQFSMLDCQQNCFGGNAAVPFGPGRQALGGSDLRACLAQCAQAIGPNVIPPISAYH